MRASALPTLVVRPRPTGGLEDQDREPAQRPLDLGLIRRLFSYTRPYRHRLAWLLAAVLIRAVQLPLGAWMIGRIIQGPVARGDGRGTLLGALAFGALVLWTAANFHFRLRLVLSLGEAVIHDLRAEVFAHLQRMTMGFYHRTKLGRIISRMTSDIDAVRTGVQDVLFVSLVQFV